LNEDYTSETTNGQSGDNEAERFSPDRGWLQVEVINRATIRISAGNTAGECQNLGLNLSSIAINETLPGTFAAAIEAILVDINLDSDFDYRVNASQNSDDSRLEEFNYPESERIDGKRILSLDDSQLTDLFRGVELIIGVEEDSIPTETCPTTNGNFYFRVTGNRAVWDCSGTLNGSWRGIQVGTETGYSIVNPENFNIVYIASEDGTTLNHVASSSSGESFRWCAENTGEEVYKIDCGPSGRLSISGITPEQLVAQANRESILANVSNSNDSSENGELFIAGSASASSAIAEAGPGVTGSTTCESEGGAFSFIICPIITYANDGIEWLDNRIINMLEINQSYYEDGGGVQQSWATIRNIAYLLLIPILLVMVISTALGFSFVDAYTVKRSLPRLFIAIIFIALSFDLAILMIEIVSVVGNGIGGLIAAPFGGTDALTLQNIFAPPSDIAGNAVWGGILAFGGVYLLSSVSLPIIGSFLLVGFLALAIIFILLVIRELIVLFLIIVAPLAILSWIFPGNDKLWKIWWQSFSKLLYLFPIIIAALISGRAFASLVSSTPTEENAVILTLIKLVAFIGPFFFIPKAFQMAGGAFASIAGMANNTSKGVFDSQRKKRGEAKAKVKADADKGNRFHGGTENNLRGRLNRGLQGGRMVTSGKAGLNPANIRREARRTARSTGREEQQALMKENPDVTTAMVDDNLSRAVLAGGSEEETRAELAATGRYSPGRELEDAVSTVRRAQRAGSSSAVNAAMAVGLAASKTGYSSHSDMYETVIRASGGDEAMERALLADVKKASEGARPEFAANGYTDSYDAMQEVKATMGMDPASRPARTRDLNARMRRDSLRKTGALAMLAGKPSQTVALEMQELGTAFDTARDNGNIEEMTEIASEITSYRGAMGSANPEARQHVATMLDHVGVDTSLINPTTGMAVSTDEQLGAIVGGLASPGLTPELAKQRARTATQEIRTRAGLYDAGGGDRTPAELRGALPPDET